jgi:RNA-directed DNA polymerase
MSEQRQKNRSEQEVLAFAGEGRSNAPKTPGKGTETLVAKRKSGSLAGTERLMEEVCELENSKPALQRVKANKRSPGVDGMTIEGRGATMAREVSRIQLHWRTRTSAAHRSQGHCPL